MITLRFSSADALNTAPFNFRNSRITTSAMRLLLSAILDAATANAHVGQWLRDVATPRIHAETKERPVDRFAQESGHLLPRGPAWSENAPSIPVDLRDIAVPQKGTDATRLRVGDGRVVMIDADVIDVIRIAPRGSAYRERKVAWTT